MQLIEQLRAQLDVLNALIEQMRWRNERIAKAIASATNPTTGGFSMPTIIKIAYEIDEKVVSAIETHLETVPRSDVNWNGAQFIIERDDFTWIDGTDEINDTILLDQIHDILRASE